MIQTFIYSWYLVPDVWKKESLYLNQMYDSIKSTTFGEFYIRITEIPNVFEKSHKV